MEEQVQVEIKTKSIVSVTFNGITREMNLKHRLSRTHGRREINAVKIGLVVNVLGYTAEDFFVALQSNKAANDLIACVDSTTEKIVSVWEKKYAPEKLQVLRML